MRGDSIPYRGVLRALDPTLAPPVGEDSAPILGVCCSLTEIEIKYFRKAKNVIAVRPCALSKLII
jgi:hypothetical protein